MLAVEGKRARGWAENYGRTLINKRPKNPLVDNVPDAHGVLLRLGFRACVRMRGKAGSPGRLEAPPGEVG